MVLAWAIIAERGLSDCSEDLIFLMIHTATMINPISNILPSTASTITRMLLEVWTLYQIVSVMGTVFRLTKLTETS
jgi:hypothetical protein